MNYIPAKVIACWEIDNPEGELYKALIMDNQTVVLASGRYAHCSGCKIVSWQAFLSGELNELITNTIGSEILNELHDKLRSIT